MGGRGLGAFPGTSAACQGSGTVPLGSLRGPVPSSAYLPAWVWGLRMLGGTVLSVA